MRSYGKSILLAAAVCSLLFIGAAFGQENVSTVPAKVGQIQEPVLRDALAMYSPDYDSLPRGEQINAFTNIYKVLNNGSLPPLTAEESQMLAQTRSYLYAPPAQGTVGIYDPWADPSYNPYYDDWGWGGGSGFSFGIGIGGGDWGWGGPGWYGGRGGRGGHGGGGHHGGGGGGGGGRHGGRR